MLRMERVSGSGQSSTNLKETSDWRLAVWQSHDTMSCLNMQLNIRVAEIFHSKGLDNPISFWQAPLIHLTCFCCFSSNLYLAVWLESQAKGCWNWGYNFCPLLLMKQIVWTSSFSSVLLWSRTFNSEIWAIVQVFFFWDAHQWLLYQSSNWNQLLSSNCI